MHPIGELIRKRMAFGAWCVFEEELLDEARCRRVREMGLDFGYVAFAADHANVKPILDACQRNGLLVLCFDPQVQRLFADQAFRLPAAIRDYKDHPALAGFCLRDEPGVDDFPRLKKLTAACLAEAPDKLPAVNLYPNYANRNQMGCETYEEHMERYADELALDTISYDFYPLYGLPTGETWLQDNYLRNFEVVARACRRKGCDMWYFIQTLAFNHILRDPTEEDFRWQIYCAMAFGAKVIQLFTYGTPGNGDEIFEDSIIDRQGNATFRYDIAKKVIGEMNRITGHYVPYTWEGAMTDETGLTARERTVEIVFPGYKRQKHLLGNYLELDHPLERFDPITSFKGEHPLLMGCFTRGEQRAFVLVNMADPGQRLENPARVTFDGPKTLRVHGKDGTREVTTDGVWQITLGVGEGLFVEIL